METYQPNLDPAPRSEAVDSYITASAPPPPEQGIFLGRFGLRAGWSALIFLVVFAISLVLATLLGITATGQWKHVLQQQKEAAAAKQAGRPAPRHAPSDFTPGKATTSESLQFAALCLATFVMAKIERRRMRVFGIGRSRMSDLVPGAVWGLVSLSVLIGILHALHLLVFDGVALHGGAILRFGFEWLVMFFFVGLLEEYLMRGYLQYTLTRGFFGIGSSAAPSTQRAIGFWTAAIVMSLLFSCAHIGNGGENVMGLVMVFVAGIVFSYALWRTGSLWWGIGFHMAWDWAQSFLWGVPDSGNLSYGRLLNTHPVGKVLLSGGSDGPEGSIFVIPVMLLVLLAIRTARPGVQPPLDIEAVPAEPASLQLAG